MGIPVIGCDCAVCKSPNQRNKRKRSSALLSVDGKRFLIDAGPDFRAQALEYGIDRLDGLLLTHTHYDHIAGIDELRIFYFLQKRPLPTLLSKATCEELKMRYPYLFAEDVERTSAAKLLWHVLEDEMGAVEFEGVRFEYLSYWQAGMQVTGYRIGDLAYVTDIQNGDELIKPLQGVKTLVVNALRYRASPVHLTVPEAINFAQNVGAKQTYFMHIDHETDIEKELPDGMQFAYDGLEVEF